MRDGSIHVQGARCCSNRALSPSVRQSTDGTPWHSATVPAEAASGREPFTGLSIGDAAVWRQESGNEGRFLGCDSTLLNRKESRIQNPESKKLHSNDLRAFPPIRDFASIAWTRTEEHLSAKGARNSSEFCILAPEFWVRIHYCGSHPGSCCGASRCSRMRTSASSIRTVGYRDKTLKLNGLRTWAGGAAEQVERAMGIEPTWPAWKAGVLPLNYARSKASGEASL